MERENEIVNDKKKSGVTIFRQTNNNPGRHVVSDEFDGLVLINVTAMHRKFKEIFLG